MKPLTVHDEINRLAISRLLTDLAETLTSLSHVDSSVSIRNGVIMTDVGYVIPDHHGNWSVRYLVKDDTLAPRGTHNDDD